MTLGEQVQKLQKENDRKTVVISCLEKYLTEEQIEKALNETNKLFTPRE